LKYHARIDIHGEVLPAARDRVSETEKDCRSNVPKRQLARAAYWIRLPAEISRTTERERLPGRDRSGGIDVVSVIGEQAGTHVNTTKHIVVIRDLERPQIDVTVLSDAAPVVSVAVIEKVKTNPHIRAIGHAHGAFDSDT